MKLTEFLDALEKAASKYLLKPRILVKTDNAVKARIEVSDNIYIQFSIFIRYRVLRITYLWDGAIDYTEGTVWEVAGIGILLRTQKCMIRKVMEQMKLLQKSSLMKCSRYY